MRVFTKQFRFSYWLVRSFLAKHLRIIVVVCVGAFLFMFFSGTIMNFFSVVFSFNKQTIGLVVSPRSAGTGLPLEVLRRLSRSLVEYSAQGQLFPQLAQKVTMGQGGKVYDLVLKDTITWQDGTRFTANSIPDQLLNFDRTKKQIIDERTIRFTLLVDKPPSTFPSLLTAPLVNEKLVGVQGDYLLRSIRYRFGELESVTLSPARENAPMIQYRMYKSQDDLVLGYKLGEVDQFSTYTKSVADELGRWRNTSLDRVVDVKKITTLFINTQNPPLDNRSVRQAIAQSMNYQELTDYGVRAYSSILPFSWAYNKDIAIYNYEPDIARGLLKESSSNETKLVFYSSYDLHDVAERIERYLEEVGFDVELRYTNYTPVSYDLYLVIIEPDVDPDQYIFWHSSRNIEPNFSKLKDVRVDNALEQGRLEFSEKKRRESYFKFQELLADEVPAVFLYYPYLYLIERK